MGPTERGGVVSLGPFVLTSSRWIPGVWCPELLQGPVTPVFGSSVVELRRSLRLRDVGRSERPSPTVSVVSGYGQGRPEGSAPTDERERGREPSSRTGSSRVSPPSR